METLDSLKEFDALRISVASPEDIISWSHGEITKPETINYRTFKAEKDGLFDERIFGPTKDFECYCGKYKRIRYKGVICDKCGVEVTYSRVRRERMGHISLASPCAHVWYFRGIPSSAGILLDVSPRDLEGVIYFASFLVTKFNIAKRAEVLGHLSKKLAESKERLEKDWQRRIEIREKETEKEVSALQKLDDKERALGKREALLNTMRRDVSNLREGLANETGKLEERFKGWESYLKTLNYLSIIPEAQYSELAEYIDRFAEVAMGAEAAEKALQDVDLDEIARSLQRRLSKSSGPRKIKLAKRMRLVEGLRQAKINPSWMVLKHIAVIPPDLRPMVQLEGGRFATSDHNDLYRRVINRNNRLRKLMELGAPEIIIRNEKRMLQEAVDALIDSSKQHTQVRPMRGKQKLRSLSDLLKGKQGRFRRNLLGKRVDYSGRSVIVVGPHLKLDECGLPKDMALELFKPFVLREIMVRGLAPNLKSSRYVLDQGGDEIWDILEDIVKDHPVLLNRAPTLHRLGIQAFYPKLIDGYAIQLHPCVCTGYNADFDGDQMAVHIPLSDNARREANDLMLSSKNLLYPSSGVPITIPNREMLVGLHYLTSIKKVEGREPKIFADQADALTAYESGKLYLREQIKVRINEMLVETSVGRITFNKILPASFEYFNDEINKENGALKKLIERSLLREGRVRTVRLIDDLKRIGFHSSTLSGISMAVTDGKINPKKYEIIEESSKKATEIDRNFRRGLITKREKMRLLEQVWTNATNTVDKLTWDNLEKDNPIKMMVSSGARGTRDMVKQIAGMRGLIVDPTGHLVELPVRSNYVEGLSGFEYFASARGTRKGLVDSALKTADAGYLTRRLVDVAQEVIIRTEDCGTHLGVVVIKGEETMLTSFTDRLLGRVLAEDIKEPKTKKVIFKAGTLIEEELAAKFIEAGVTRVVGRSPMTCEASYGICAACYGRDMSTKKLVAVGTAVGVVAAQSIGEPGTQLTLRTYHTGGIVGKDITQGLPRVEEVFEARNPGSLALMSETDGKVKVVTDNERRKIIITSTEEMTTGQETVFEIDQTAELLVSDGDVVAAGQALTEGHLPLNRLVQLVGVGKTQKYIISEIQKVYSTQGVNLHDKHIEVIVRQMFSRVRIDNPGQTHFLPGEITSRYSFEEANEQVLESGQRPATAKLILLGITKSSLATESFLAAASFQETTRVLTEAALSGKVDRLLGLKENVIIGRLIPTGERVRVTPSK